MTPKNYVIADLSHFIETYSIKIHTSKFSEPKVTRH